jgi:GR25 family glycosyltransferase involved in LPS biosynthesis
MNISKPLNRISRVLSSALRIFREYLPRQRCSTFGVKSKISDSGIDQIVVINLDRQPVRWNAVKRELDRVLDDEGTPIRLLANRHSACDARSDLAPNAQTPDIATTYTLRDQLFVEPQPALTIEDFDLERPITMTDAEVAVAQSHIDVWREISQSDFQCVLVLEDDAIFCRGFGRYLDKAWSEMRSCDNGSPTFDVMYLSYKEVRGGAPKKLLSQRVFRPKRGLWYLSGYLLTKEGAKKLLDLLPCRGPVDLWINHQFSKLDVRGLRKPLILQRNDLSSTNSYSILPILGQIGVINSGQNSLYNHRPSFLPLFVCAPRNSDISSLAMAISMLGYRCCSFVDTVPAYEMNQLSSRGTNRVFDAYVNVDSLKPRIGKLLQLYSQSKLIVVGDSNDLIGLDVDKLAEKGIALRISRTEATGWRTICKFLRLAPPLAPFPISATATQRILEKGTENAQCTSGQKWLRSDPSPWVVPKTRGWIGIPLVPTEESVYLGHSRFCFTDSFEKIDPKYWTRRNDTFPGNLGLFRQQNLECSLGKGLSSKNLLA